MRLIHINNLEGNVSQIFYYLNLKRKEFSNKSTRKSVNYPEKKST